MTKTPDLQPEITLQNVLLGATGLLITLSVVVGMIYQIGKPWTCKQAQQQAIKAEATYNTATRQALSTGLKTPTQAQFDQRWAQVAYDDHLKAQQKVRNLCN